MNITIVVPNLTLGGIQTQVYYLAKYLKVVHGYQVTIYGLLSIESRFISLLDQAGIGYHFRPDLGELIWAYESKHTLGKLSVWLKLWWFLLCRGRIILLPYTKNLDTFFNPLVNFTLVRGTFSFERGGHSNPLRESSSLINKLRKRANPIYVANSEHGKKAIHQIRGVLLDKIHVIPNGIDLERFSLDSKTERERLTVVMIANYFPQKEHLFVLNAWSLMPPLLKSKVHLKLVGLGGGLTCQANFEKAESMVRELNLTKDVQFIKKPPGVKVLLRDSDIGLLATKSEGCPNVILEYMAMGLPILASKIPGIEEVISDKNKPYLFFREDIKDFIDKLSALVEDSVLRKELSSHNNMHVRKKYGIERMGEAYASLIENF